MEELNIKIESESFSINGIEIKNSITENKLIKVIGIPDREVNNRQGYLLYNGTYIYDRLGMTIEFFHGKVSYMELIFTPKPSFVGPESIPHCIFKGSLTINGIEIPRVEKNKESLSKDYIKKLNQVFEILNGGKILSKRIDRHYCIVNNIRIGFQFDYQKTNGLEAISLSFETRKSKLKKNKL